MVRINSVGHCIRSGGVVVGFGLFGYVPSAVCTVCWTLVVCFMICCCCLV